MSLTFLSARYANAEHTAATATTAEEGDVMLGVRHRDDDWQALLASDVEVEPYVAPLPPPAVGNLTNEAAIRFTVASGVVAVAPNCLNLSLVMRVSVGRYRAYFVRAAANTDYIPSQPSVMDSLVRMARVSAKTTAYIEIRIVDQAGAAADAQEVGLIIQRIIWT